MDMTVGIASPLACCPLPDLLLSHLPSCPVPPVDIGSRDDTVRPLADSPAKCFHWPFPAVLKSSMVSSHGCKSSIVGGALFGRHFPGACCSSSHQPDIFPHEGLPCLGCPDHFLCPAACPWTSEVSCELLQETHAHACRFFMTWYFGGCRHSADYI